jgi:hypothetical protein
MDAEKLESLGGMIDEVQGPDPEQQAEQQQQAQQQEATEAGARSWGVIAYMVGNSLAMLAPELKSIYTEDACLNWGRAMMPVAEKRGWNAPSSLPELGLFIATASMVMPTVIIVRAKLIAIKAGRKEGVAGWVGGVVAWWQERKARKAAADHTARTGQGAADGG